MAPKVPPMLPPVAMKSEHVDKRGKVKAEEHSEEEEPGVAVTSPAYSEDQSIRQVDVGARSSGSVDPPPVALNTQSKASGAAPPVNRPVDWGFAVKEMIDFLGAVNSDDQLDVVTDECMRKFEKLPVDSVNLDVLKDADNDVQILTTSS